MILCMEPKYTPHVPYVVRICSDTFLDSTLKVQYFDIAYVESRSYL